MTPGIGHNGGPPLDEDEDGIAEAAEFQAIMGMTVEDILREGQKALFATLVYKCRTGKASHQELAILRNILKDNGLTLGIPPRSPSRVVRRWTSRRSMMARSTHERDRSPER